jgi:hypothetical protein
MIDDWFALCENRTGIFNRFSDLVARNGNIFSSVPMRSHTDHINTHRGYRPRTRTGNRENIANIIYKYDIFSIDVMNNMVLV